MIAAGSIVHDRYEVIRLLGQGGMGAVYEALDRHLQAQVALKQMLVHGELFTRQFVREAHILASLRHPALPLVSDYFVIDGISFLVMEYVAGSTLADSLGKRGAPFTIAEVLPWADELLAVLSYLHCHTPPIIHRDIKPQNIKLTPDGHVVLLDFGLAKGATDGSLALAVGSIFGFTPGYAPMEQIQGSGTDARSDIYALGATLYTLLSGNVPPNAPLRVNALLDQQPDPLLPLNQLNPGLPPALADVIQATLALDPHDRPATAEMVRTCLHTAWPGIAGSPRLKRLSIQLARHNALVAPVVHSGPAPVSDTSLSGLPASAPVQALAAPHPISPATMHQWWWYGEWLLWLPILCGLGLAAADFAGLIVGVGIATLALILLRSPDEDG